MSKKRTTTTPQPQSDIDTFELFEVFHSSAPLLAKLTEDLRSGKIREASDTKIRDYHSTLSRVVAYMNEMVEKSPYEDHHVNLESVIKRAARR